MRKRTFVTLILAAMAFAAVAAAQTTPPAQEKKPVDTAKLFAEIAGAYSYSLNGEEMVVNFWVESGKLYGAPQGEENDYAEVVLKDAEKLVFEAQPQAGQLFVIQFVRGESGKFEKSILNSPSQGLEVTGVKIK